MEKYLIWRHFTDGPPFGLFFPPTLPPGCLPPMKISHLFRFLTVAGLLCAFPACTGWPRGWGKSKRLPSGDGVSGAWTGTWHSIPSGHRGRLRCAVFPKSPGVWEYRYRATWAHFLCAGFNVDCQGFPQPDGSLRITGQRDLGPVFGGVFSHEGRVQGNQLEAAYSASLDRGTLSLRRLASPE